MRIRVLSSFVLGAGLTLLAASASAVTIDWVRIGDPGNAPDTASNCVAANCGSVPYAYYISTYEVTNAQYTEFLNAKAATDPLLLYHPNMDTDPQGGITRSGSDGSYAYAVKPGFESKPVNFVGLWDAMRFTNWLHNGQGAGATETGSYTLSGGTPEPSNRLSITRSPGATIVVPSENEWYKAAYYDSLSATYFDYPVGTDAQVICAAPGSTPNTVNCGNVVAGLTDVGSYTGSPSPYGTFDQGGNVREWNEQFISGFVSGFGTRGGAWNATAANVASSQWGAALNLTFHVSSQGFRVASLVPEPGTLVLVLTGLVGLSWKQRRS